MLLHIDLFLIPRRSFPFHEQVASHPDAEAVVTGIVGCAGLAPTCAAITAGKDICLANKETLIAGTPPPPHLKNFPSEDNALWTVSAKPTALLCYQPRHSYIFWMP